MIKQDSKLSLCPKLAFFCPKLTFVTNENFSLLLLGVYCGHLKLSAFRTFCLLATDALTMRLRQDILNRSLFAERIQAVGQNGCDDCALISILFMIEIISVML